MDYLLNLWDFNLFVVIINCVYALLPLEGSGFYFSDGFRQVLDAKSPCGESALLVVQAALCFHRYVSESQTVDRTKKSSQPGELYYGFSSFISLVNNMFLAPYTCSLMLTLLHLNSVDWLGFSELQLSLRI